MIVSRQNQKVKDIRRLRRCKGDQAILEGPHLLGEALQTGLVPETVLATAEFLASRTGVDLLADNDTLPITEVAPHLIDYLCDADSPRGVLAVVSLPRAGLESIPVQDKGLYVFVDGMQDPGNLGALVRVAEAFYATGVILAPGTVHPNHSRSLRASAGSLLRAEVFTDVSSEDLRDRLAQEQPDWWVLTPRGGTPIGDLEPKRGVVLAVGAEGPGVSPGLLKMAHTAVTIPLQGQVESLNSTVAAAIALYVLQVFRSRF